MATVPVKRKTQAKAMLWFLHKGPRDPPQRDIGWEFAATVGDLCSDLMFLGLAFQVWSVWVNLLAPVKHIGSASFIASAETC